MIKDIHSAALNVGDLEAAVDFYCTQGVYELLERFDIENTEETRAAYELPNPTGRAALLRGHGAFLELNQFEDSVIPAAGSREVFDAGLRHICIRAQDVHSLFDGLTAVGATSHARPSELGTGLEYAYIRDPEGNLLELEGLAMVPPGVIQPWFDHMAIVTSDINRLSDFYAMLTETQVSRRESLGPAAHFDKVAGLDGIVFDGAWIVFGVSRIEMWQYKEPITIAKQPPAANQIGWSHLCFEVEELDVEMDRLRAAGVPFLGKPYSSRQGRSVFLRDFDGNRIKLFEVSTARPELSVSSLPTRPILDQIREVSEGSRRSKSKTV